MSYIIGIDGGGTKTHCLLTDFNGNVLHECYSGPSNFLVHGIDRLKNLLSLINHAGKFKISRKILIILLGTAVLEDEVCRKT
jgi:N-acetylglucosamine kinase-like BadF-type ATPase